MARSISEIQQKILAAKQDAAELNALEVLTEDEKSSISNLNSTSKVSIWRLWVYIIAVCIWSFEKILDLFKAEVEEIVKNNRPHNEDWYKKKALAFQYGDNLVDSDEYDVIDPEKQIIKQVAILEGDRKIVVKIATVEDNELVPLPEVDQLNAFAAYMNKIKDAGSVIEIINQSADALKVEIDYYYDPLIVNSSGLLIDNPQQSVVLTAINAYLGSLEFNGQFDINKMTDYVQSAPGYKSCKINFVGFRAGLSTSFSPISRVYEPISGYMKIQLSDLIVNYYAVV